MKICKIALSLLFVSNARNQSLAQGEDFVSSAFQSTLGHQLWDEPKKNRYIVKFKDGSTELEARMQRAINRDRVENLRNPPSSEELSFAFGSFLPKENAEVLYLDSEEEVKMWEEKDDVEYVELDTKIHLQAEEIPYGITRVQALRVSDSDVSNRKVCIIDSGYDITHPDLSSDPNTVTGYNGSFSAGAWDYDGHGHGTHVAGTIAAIGGNNRGVVGVNRNGELKLHIVKVFNNNGDYAWRSDLIAAVEICVDSGANIVNMSLGGEGFSQIENDAYDRIFNDDNVLLVAAAGNDGSTAYSYPASYDHVMSVAAIDSNKNVASFSQKNDKVDIAAPGVEVTSTLPRRVASSGYDSWDGTSMATPHVSGVAALIWSLDTGKSAAEIRGMLEASAEDLGPPGRDNSYGHGMLRADRAKRLFDGGFTLSPTKSPVISPPSCKDDPERWHDSDGQFYDCEWYAQGSNCALHGDSFENYGKTASEACCACGGGSSGRSKPTEYPTTSPTKFPTESPSASPTRSPTKAPANSPNCSQEGGALLRVEVTTDSNGAAENKFVVRRRNMGGRFKKRVWMEQSFQDNTTETFELCLPVNQCYKLFMIDFGQDGMCCENGEGGFKVIWDDYLVMDTLSEFTFMNKRRVVTPKFGDAC